MSELNNPLFDDPREFLERQKEEYKNALLSDVADIKNQSQQIGKNIAIGAAVLGGIYLLSRALNGNKEEKAHKKRLKRLNPAKFKGAEDRAWISSIPEVEDDEPLYSTMERTYPAVYHPTTGTVVAPAPRQKEPSAFKAFLQSDLFKMIEQQLATMLMVYVTKLIEQHLSAPAEGEQPVLVEQVTAQIEVPVEPQGDVHAQPLQL